jgi:hypothetical protein
MNINMATPHGTITLRPVVEADVALLRDLRLEALRTHPAMFSADYTTHLNLPSTKVRGFREPPCDGVRGSFRSRNV